MIVDYHIHAPYCGHAQGKTIEYVQSAIAHKVNQAGFSDHLGRYYLSLSQQKRYWNWGMDEEKLPRYIEELMALRDVYQSRIDIRIGLEVDYIEGAEDSLSAIIDKYPLDFITGSVHCIPQFGWQHLTDIPPTDPETLYNAYFNTVTKALQSGLFQTVAHIDFIWRYLKWPTNKPSFVFDHIEQLCKTAGQSSTAIEINANGHLWSQTNQIEGVDPFTFFINQIRKNSIMVTLGSDAHSPKHVAKNFDQIIPYLHDLGIRSVATFKNKHMTLVPLSLTP